MKTSLVALIFVITAIKPVAAMAEREQRIESNRILLGDVVENIPVELEKIDLGPSPRAGSSRLISAEELNRTLKASGETQTVHEGVRVIRSSKRWTQTELTEWLTPAIKLSLPTFATLIRIESPRSLTLPSEATLGRVEFSQLPKRRGTANTTLIVHVTANGELEQRLMLKAVVNLSEQQKPDVIARNTSLNLSIRLGTANVSTIGTTLQSGEVGSIVLCRVVKTKKVLRARIISNNSAEVLSE